MIKVYNCSKAKTKRSPELVDHVEIKSLKARDSGSASPGRLVHNGWGNIVWGSDNGLVGLWIVRA
jgi:hypothetical protein